MYITPLSPVVFLLFLNHHLYADVTQFFFSGLKVILTNLELFSGRRLEMVTKLWLGY